MSPDDPRTPPPDDDVADTADDDSTDESEDDTGTADDEANAVSEDDSTDAPDDDSTDTPDNDSTAASDEDSTGTSDDDVQAASDGDPTDTSDADSTANDGDDCAEIPAYPHAVVVADVKLAVRLPYSTDQAAALAYKFTLSNEDNSYSKSLTTADCQAGDVEGTSMLTFEDLTEDHSYSLACDDGRTTYVLFQNVSYDHVMHLGGQAAADGGSSAEGSPADSSSTDSSASDAGSDTGVDATGPT